ncbi:hypothetical protein [Paenibacillus sp. MMO-58]|uniref:hypothetical protein n=1 Tax=Paenibacillus sp. MMO-58 TaxID=3081290 RepID=UPI00301B36E2
MENQMKRKAAGSIRNDYLKISFLRSNKVTGAGASKQWKRIEKWIVLNHTHIALNKSNAVIGHIIPVEMLPRPSLTLL